MPAPFNPLAPPDEAFWVGDLRVHRFGDLARLVQGGALAAECDRLWSLPADCAAAQAVLEAWGSEHGRAHLVLLAWFAEEKSYKAIDAACRRALPEPLLSASLQGPNRRLAALARLLQNAPAALVDVYYWNAWFTRDRATLKMQGHLRRSQAPLAEAPWDDLAREGLRRVQLPAELEGLQYERALVRHWLYDVLLVFRRHDTASVHWDPTEKVARAIPREELTLLRFISRGARVEVTPPECESALPLASAIGSALFGAPVEYKHARHALTRRRLEGFLQRVLDPDDSVFTLHEIVGTTAEQADPAIFAINRPGHGRIEELIRAQRRHHGFARDSRHVHRVTIGFVDEGQHHRISLFFPESDDEERDLALSLADMSTDKDTVDRFRMKMLTELDVEINPKVVDAGRHRRVEGEEPKPRRLAAEDYEHLLAGRLDAPAKWQVEELEALARRGLVEVRHEAVFRCGDSRVQTLARPPGSLRCLAELTLPFRAVSDDDDAFAQEPGTRITCDNGHEWSLDRVRPAWFHRVRVSVLGSAVLAWLRAELGGERWTEDEPGVFTRPIPGRGRRVLVVLDAAASDWRHSVIPRCRWIRLDPSVDSDQLPAISLARLLAEGIGVVALTYADEVAAVEAEGVDVWVEPDDTGGIRRGAQTIIGPQKARCRLLFALLQAWGERQGWETLAKRTDLCAFDESGTLTPSTIAQLLHALSQEVGKATAETLVENQGKSGLRLRPPLRARGFRLDDELDSLKDRSRPRVEK